MLPPPVQRLVQLLTRLPSVGNKTAHRYALYLATSSTDTATALGDALHALAAGVGSCSLCGNLAEVVAGADDPPQCDICRDTRRDDGVLCIVARIVDLLSIERSNAFRGRYFVLGKLLSPLEGVGAEQLPLERLADRIAQLATREVLVATPPSVDGEATALLLAQRLRPLGVAVTRIASGVPHGGDLEYADPVTIGRAIAHRRGLD